MSAELLEDDEDLKQRTRPMVIAVSRVNGNHRSIEAFKSVLRCMIEADGEQVIQWFKKNESNPARKNKTRTYQSFR